MKQYKAVAGPKNVNVFADIINREAAGGWAYHSMETITVTEKPGCLQQAIPVNYYMLIFEKDI